MDKMFKVYTKCSRKYEDSLSHQEEVEHGKMVEEYNSVCRNKEELDYRLEEWLKRAQAKPKDKISEDLVQDERATFGVEDHGRVKANEFLNTQSQSNQGLVITPTSALPSVHYSKENWTGVVGGDKGSVKSFGSDLSTRSKTSVKSKASIKRSKAEMEMKQCKEMQVPVRVRGGDESKEIETYALLDDGADKSLCESSPVRRLGITGTPTTFSLTTINDETKENHGEEVRLVVSSLNGTENVEMSRAWRVNGASQQRKVHHIGNISME